MGQPPSAVRSCEARQIFAEGHVFNTAGFCSAGQPRAAVPTWFLLVAGIPTGGQMIGTNLTLQLREVSVLVVVALGCAFDKLQKVSQVGTFRGFKFGKFDAYSE